MMTTAEIDRTTDILKARTADNAERFGCSEREAFEMAYLRFASEHPEVGLFYSLVMISRERNGVLPGVSAPDPRGDLRVPRGPSGRRDRHLLVRRMKEVLWALVVLVDLGILLLLATVYGASLYESERRRTDRDRNRTARRLIEVLVVVIVLNFLALVSALVQV